MYNYPSFWAISPLIFYLSLTAYAGETGKIAGKVTDAETGDPLPGTNVIVAGTNLSTLSCSVIKHIFIKTLSWR